MSILDQIVEDKKALVARCKAAIPEASLRDEAFAIAKTREKRPFFKSLATPGPYGANVIAEIKRASPSKGDIKLDLDPAFLAKAYEEGGAAAISVLTDTPYFKGSLEDLKIARKHSTLPILRKEFIISPYQLYEAVLAGADAVLLIVRILSKSELNEYLSLCEELCLDTLVEIYAEDELEIAAASGAKLIGINNRNLATFDTDTKNAIGLGGRLAPGQIPVAASGILGPEDIQRAKAAGVFNFLIGESLVRAQDPAGFLKTLMGRDEEPKVGR